MTYALLIYRATEVGKEPPGIDERATLRGHRALQAEASARADLHAVARLEESRDARTVRRSGGAHEVIDGPFVETKEWLVGFYLIDCKDEAEAIARAKQTAPMTSTSSRSAPSHGCGSRDRRR